MGLPESFRGKENALEASIGKEVVISCPHGEACGVLADINQVAGEIYLCPYIDLMADKKSAFISDLVFAVSLSNFSAGKTYSIAQKPDGYMKSVVAFSRKTSALGFNGSKD